MTAPNPLVAQANDVKAWEGSRVFQNLGEAAQAAGRDDPDPVELGAGFAAAGLDLLGAAMNPLAALASAGVGWVIEHVDFLREPLDMLAGDPTQIAAHAQTWQNVSRELETVAAQYRSEAGQLQGWDGAAAESYRLAAGNVADSWSTTAGQAGAMSKLVSTTGAMVGTVRATIRDAISEFVGELIADAVAALAAAAPSLGASVAAFLTRAVVGAARLASSIASKLARVLEMLGRNADQLRRLAARLGDIGDAARQVSHAVDSTTETVGNAVRGMGRFGKEATRRLDNAGLAGLADSTPLQATAEYAKQDAEGRRALSEGPPPAAQ